MLGRSREEKGSLFEVNWRKNIKFNERNKEKQGIKENSPTYEGIALLINFLAIPSIKRIVSYYAEEVSKCQGEQFSIHVA